MLEQFVRENVENITSKYTSLRENVYFEWKRYVDISTRDKNNEFVDFTSVKTINSETTETLFHIFVKINMCSRMYYFAIVYDILITQCVCVNYVARGKRYKIEQGLYQISIFDPFNHTTGSIGNFKYYFFLLICRFLSVNTPCKFVVITFFFFFFYIVLIIHHGIRHHVLIRFHI